MKKSKKGTKKGTKKATERGARFGAALLVLVAVVVMFFATSFVFRLAREIPKSENESVPSGIRVEVLNGSGRNRIARRVALILREKGFDVVNIDNAQSQDFAKTVVVDRVSGDMRYAKLLARKIGCGEVVAQPDPSLYLEITVIVGKDCDRLFPDAVRERR